MTEDTFSFKLRNCSRCLKIRLAIGIALFLLGGFILAVTAITWKGTTNGE